MPSRLRERQFGAGDREGWLKFFNEIKKTHKDVIRGTEQEDGLLVRWVRYGEDRADEITEAARVLFNPEPIKKITVEAEGEPTTAALALPAEGFVPLEAIEPVNSTEIQRGNSADGGPPEGGPDVEQEAN